MRGGVVGRTIMHVQIRENVRLQCVNACISHSVHIEKTLAWQLQAQHLSTLEWWPWTLYLAVVFAF